MERGRVLDRGRERSLGSDGIAATSQAASYLRRLRDSGGCGDLARGHAPWKEGNLAAVILLCN